MMNLKDEYLNKLKSIEIDTTNIAIQDYEKFSIVSFSDEVEGELLNISVTFFVDDLDYEIIIRRKVEVIDRGQSLEKINAYNTKYSGVAFYLEGDELYVIRILERFDKDIQEVLTNITTIIEIILLNDI